MINEEQYDKIKIGSIIHYNGASGNNLVGVVNYVLDSVEIKEHNYGKWITLFTSAKVVMVANDPFPIGIHQVQTLICE